MQVDEETQKTILRVGHRARIWAMLGMNPGIYYTPTEISEKTGLKKSSVEQGLKFVRRLPGIDVNVKYQNNEKIIRYAFVQILSQPT